MAESRRQSVSNGCRWMRPCQSRNSWARTVKACHSSFFPSAHANLCAAIELEINLVHVLSDKENAPAMWGQQILRGNWVGKPSWIEPRTRILDTHEQIAVLVHGDEDAYSFLRIAVVTVNNILGKSLSYGQARSLSLAAP